jgi:tetratricopeptide (TPR) repeat protein
MRLIAFNPHAEALVRDGIRDIDTYRRTKRVDALNTARHKLEQAQVEEPEYILGLYAQAILNDLSGKAADAIPEFQKVLAHRPPFADEAEYYLGLAHYHRYDWLNLDEAIKILSTVATRTSNLTLQYRARITLLQAFAMRMIPRDPQDPDVNEIKHLFRTANKEYRDIEAKLRELPATHDVMFDEMKADLSNAIAMVLMYWSDYCGTDTEKITSLERAIRKLLLADQQSPNSWAIHCDLGSAWMRLGHWQHKRAFLSRAVTCLTKVIEELRPNYGFALYELGRVYRLMGNFAEAVIWFDRASAIPSPYRDVSDRRLLLEQERVTVGTTEYP